MDDANRARASSFASSASSRLLRSSCSRTRAISKEPVSFHVVSRVRSDCSNCSRSYWICTSASAASTELGFWARRSLSHSMPRSNASVWPWVSCVFQMLSSRSSPIRSALGWAFSASTVRSASRMSPFRARSEARSSEKNEERGRRSPNSRTRSRNASSFSSGAPLPCRRIIRSAMFVSLGSSSRARSSADRAVS